MKRVMHVDMNSFFASCEQAENVELVGKKIAVAGDPKKRHGIILAASYEAKRVGVKTTMSIWRAMEICKDLIVIPCHHHLYYEYSTKVMSILREYTPVLEQTSVDEAYLDLNQTEVIYPDLLKLAKEIQDRILNELGLPCSIGISENKLLAKMASEYKKPLGITEIYREDMERTLYPKSVSEMYGIGKSTEKFLKSIGVFTIGELAKYDGEVLKLYLGEKAAEYLIRACNGIDDSEVVPSDEVDAKSMGNEQTFSRDIKSLKVIKQKLLELSDKVSYRLRSAHKKAKTVCVKIKYANFVVVTRSKTIQDYTNLTDTIYEVAAELVSYNLSTLTPIRLLGVSCATLIDEKEQYTQLSLEQDPRKEMLEKKEKIEKKLDILKNKYGEGIIKRAWSLEEEDE